MQKYTEEIFIIPGCGLVIYAFSMISKFAGVLTAGVILIILGVIIGLGKNQPIKK